MLSSLTTPPPTVVLHWWTRNSKRDPRFIFVQTEKNIGYSVVNIAYDRMHGRYLMTMDTDARLWPGALQALVAFMDIIRTRVRRPRISIIQTAPHKIIIAAS